MINANINYLRIKIKTNKNYSRIKKKWKPGKWPHKAHSVLVPG